MKYQKRMVLFSLAACAALGCSLHTARADYVVDWADGVVGYADYVQNYGGTLMSADAANESWVLGAPDADADGNGYAWDAGDPDNVAGWRTTNADQFITLEWDAGFSNIEGDDLQIRLYSGPKAAASVLASVDGVDFVEIGTIGTGTPGYLYDAAFDLDGFFADDAVVSYVKVLRTASGPQTGMFFDAVGAVVEVPEPATAVLAACGLLSLVLSARRRRNE